MYQKPIYLDCNATTPVEEEVIELMNHYLRNEYGNAGSRTHQYGTAASQAVRKAREQIAKVVDDSWENVIFTSGATESNNISIFGLTEAALKEGKKHIISTQIEHKAVLEPLEALSEKGLEVTLIPPNSGGVVEPLSIKEALRKDTFLVSVMHVNNETGTIQPLEEIADLLINHPACFHTDAAQGFGKELATLKNNRIDLISISAHKIFGPKGIGAVIQRNSERTKRLRPIMFGGGQEKGLRPGTCPVHLAAGFGLAAEISLRDFNSRRQKVLKFRTSMLDALKHLRFKVNGEMERTIPSTINMSFDDIDSEAIMIAVKDEVAISNGSACTSNSYIPSHVLKAMGLNDLEAQCSTRWSWCHLTPLVDWIRIIELIKSLR